MGGYQLDDSKSFTWKIVVEITFTIFHLITKKKVGSWVPGTPLKTEGWITWKPPHAIHLKKMVWLQGARARSGPGRSLIHLDFFGRKEFVENLERAVHKWLTSHLGAFEDDLSSDQNQGIRFFMHLYMGVSKNRGTPKSSIFVGFSIINHPFWGATIFGNTHIYSFIPSFIPSLPSLVGGFSYFYVHPDPWGNDPIWRAYFWNGLVKNHQLVTCLFFVQLFFQGASFF